MRVRSKLLAGGLLAGMVFVPVLASAQTIVIAPLPPMSRAQAMAATPAPVRIDPEAALVESTMTRSRIERRQQAAIASPRTERDVPMPRPVPSIIAP